MGEHSKISPSGLYRVIRCPGSVRLSSEVKERKSNYASSLGTAAHHLGECCLFRGDNAAKYLDWFAGENHITKEAMKTPDEHEIDFRMADGVQLYLDAVRENDFDEEFIEKHVELDFVCEGMGGTPDYVGWDCLSNHLTVIDYKNGTGVVEVEENEQLMAYALGHLVRGGGTEVTLCIVQPNARHKDGPVRKWRTTGEYLFGWLDSTLAPAVKEALSPDASCNPGDHCRWCPARGTCSARAQEMFGVVKHNPASGVIELPSADTLSPQDLGELLKVFDFLEDYKKEALSHAHVLLDKGEAVPGRKLVRKQTKRQWSKDAEYTLARELGDEAYDSRMVGLGEAEKRLRKKGRTLAEAEELISEITEKPEGGLVVAAESDKRPAIDMLQLLNDGPIEI